MGIGSIVRRAAGRAGDGVAKLSSLSPDQIRDVDERRRSYLRDMPSGDDAAATELTNRLIAAAGIEIYNAYLPQIGSMYAPIEPTMDYDGRSFDVSCNLRHLNITKWVSDPEENSIEKLVNVYEVLSSAACNIALVFHRGRRSTDVYLAVVNSSNADNHRDVEILARRLEGALRGNFPGAEWAGGLAQGRIPCLDETDGLSVASVSNVPAEKSDKFVSQTIEKLLDGFVPRSRREEYTLILLATPALDASERKLRLEQLYTGLAPYSSWQTSYTYQESKSTSSSATVGMNAGVSVGRQVGTNQSLADGRSVSDSSSQGTTDTEGSSQTDTTSTSDSDSTSHTDGTSSGTSVSDSGFVSAARDIEDGISNLEDIRRLATHAAGGILGGGHTEGTTTGTNVSDTVTHGTINSVAKAIGTSTSHAVSSTLGRAVTRSLTSTVGAFASQSLGGNFGVNFARTSTVTATIGKNEGIHQTHTNYSIKHALELLERQMRRLEGGTALGLWEFAAYVLSEDPSVASNVAHSYLALTQGEDSFVSQASVNLWRGDMDREGAAGTICSYLADLRHPVFALRPELAARQPNVLPYPTVVTATTTLTGKELARSLNFPRKSVAGLPVFECASFGRNVSTFEEPEGDGSIELGHVFHMHREEPTPVVLDLDSLAGHTFVTGSTGAGKSNAVYRILEQAARRDVGFLVIEPAKGEYKDAFGNDSDVDVFGTNPAYAPQLKLDPFSFPKGIHVLEHLDRLVEIFNVCWPMYAAMPAVLKEAIEMSYRDCGWDLDASTNEFGDDLYPCFTDVARNVRRAIDESEYDAENKGAYKGSLLTRINSLCNGINGQVFSPEEVAPETLFDSKAIVDLSRVGSSETKSLLMGVLVLKLQEWRMSQGIAANSSLRHITVLEEAHNLLRRSSAGQSIEGGNLAGKSVEMLANAIAEMRTYGEGFVIADQAPGLLDPAAIRNTNTKIVMRLPDGEDRELAGGAEALTEAQTKELARLPRGVAAVYQNNWIEAVLCKVAKARTRQTRFSFKLTEVPPDDGKATSAALHVAELLSFGVRVEDPMRLEDVREALSRLSVPSSTQVAILRQLRRPAEGVGLTTLGRMMSALFPSVRRAVEEGSVGQSPDCVDWTALAGEELARLTEDNVRDRVRRDIVQGIVTDYLYNELRDMQTFDSWYERGDVR
jgi:hypothetical protein